MNGKEVSAPEFSKRVSMLEILFPKQPFLFAPSRLRARLLVNGLNSASAFRGWTQWREGAKERQEKLKKNQRPNAVPEFAAACARSSRPRPLDDLREDAKARREKRFEGKKEPGQGSKLVLATQEPRHAFSVLLSILFFSLRLRVFAPII
ncbi:hypothetical protein [Halomonas denitrificans]|nr:hypothetical protein [Halomonas denitrificans]